METILKSAMLAVTHGGVDEDSVEHWSVAGGIADEWGVMHGPWAGEDALYFMLQFDYIMLWHWPSRFMLKRLTGDNGVRLIPMVELDAVKTYPEWNPINERLRQFFMVYGRHMSGTNNRFGHPFVDIYEASPSKWNQKPHAWSVDLRLPLDIAFAAALERELDPFATRPYAVGVDSMNTRQFFGTASNAPQSFIEPPWSRWVKSISHRCCPVVAHSGGMWGGTFMTVSEHSLRDATTADLVKGIVDAHSEGRLLGFGVNSAEDLSRLNSLQAMGITPALTQHARSGGFGFDVDWVGK